MVGVRKRIGLKDIQLLKPNETVWDDAVTGFHARRQKSPSVSYIVVYRNAEGRQRWQTIGRHGSPWTPNTARDEARRVLGRVVDGADPAAEKHRKRNAVSVAELCDLYLADIEAGRLLTRRKAAKKASTIATDKGRINRHVKPLLGGMRVDGVTHDDVDAFMYAVADGRTAGRTKTAKKHGLANVRGGKGTATRTVGLLGAIFSYAVRRRMRPDNPVRGVTRFADGRRERRLSDTEYKMFGAALVEATTREQLWPAALAAARFLILTGWRRGETLGLRWREIDLARRTATLADTKTGRSMRPLSRAACDVLRGLPQTSELVFPATRGDGQMSGFPKIWARITKLVDLPADVTPHVLRHSFASLASDLGYSEPTIAALVGHAGRSATSRYVHSADAVLLSAADAVANRTVELMDEARPDAQVIAIRA